ncbi:MAG: hypothetical protein SGPRY_005048, partial [Prymnesium sp.]
CATRGSDAREPLDPAEPSKKPQHASSVPSTFPSSGKENGQFDCNICLDTAFDPVVTICGHLYCWPCIFTWLKQQQEGQLCPVCKALISKDKVIPIYGRGRGQVDPRWAERHGQPLHSFRWGVMRGQQQDAGDGLAQAGTVSTFAAGLSFLPTFFGLPFANTTEQGGQAAEGLSPEQAQQALLSRLLLLLGSMVILCLLLF